jgi:hypothetical protein
MVTPIVLFCYNNYNRTLQTLEALKENKECKDSLLYVFQDFKENDKGWLEVNKLINDITGFKEVIIFEAKKNKGLRNSIIDGLSKLFEEYEELIILEDDIVVSKSFLTNMNKALKIYKNNEWVFSITGFNNPRRIMSIPKDYKLNYYFNTHFGCWGWATWKDRWESIDWSNRTKYVSIDSWGYEVKDYCEDNSLLNVFPVNSMVNNIGNTSGVHGTKRKFDILLHKKLNDNIIDYDNTVFINQILINNFYLYEKKLFRTMAKIKMFLGF